MRDKNMSGGPRERILETAQNLFIHQGFRSTGINQIIKEAKVARASFYDHFPSKDDLGLAYLQGVQEMMESRISPVL